MSLADRATIANMAPEYGATMGFFPIDDETLHLPAAHRAARSDEVELVERYTRSRGCSAPTTPAPRSTPRRVARSGHGRAVAGRSQAAAGSRAAARDEAVVSARRSAPVANAASPWADDAAVPRTATVENNGQSSDDRPRRGGDRRHHQLHQHQQPVGDARRRAAGQEGGRARPARPPYVKTSLAPGLARGHRLSRQGGADRAAGKARLSHVGYGCTTCIGNSGPLPEPVAEAVTAGDLVAAAVLSGNRNFEGRVNPLVKANYLASPPLVVAYALAGTTDIDLVNEPIGRAPRRPDVYCKDIWPTREEIRRRSPASVDARDVRNATATPSNPTKRGTIPVAEGTCTSGTSRAPTSRSRRSWPI
jgi:aconitate hydratase